MSALGGETDIRQQCRDVRVRPIADITGAFDSPCYGPVALGSLEHFPAMAVFALPATDVARGNQMANKPTDAAETDAPDLDRRRTIFRIALATAGAATTMYMAPVIIRIDEAEAK